MRPSPEGRELREVAPVAVRPSQNGEHGQQLEGPGLDRRVVVRQWLQPGPSLAPLGVIYTDAPVCMSEPVEMMFETIR